MHLLNKQELELYYGEFYIKYYKLSLDGINVPDELIDLIPYAEFWGSWCSDDVQVDVNDLINDAPDYAIQDLREIIEKYNAKLDIWLAGPESDLDPPSLEYEAFSAMRMTADFS